MKHNPTAIELHAELGIDAMRAKYASLPPRIDVVRNAICDVADTVFRGVSEVGKTNSGYWVDRMQRSIGLPPGNPWCMAYVQYVFSTVSDFWGKPDLLLRNSGSTQTVYEVYETLGCTHTVSNDAARADIAIWRNGKSRHGHTGIIIAWSQELPVDVRAYTTVEGNTNAAHSFEGGIVERHTWTEGRWGPWGDGGRRKNPDARYIRGVVSFEKLFKEWGNDYLPD